MYITLNSVIKFAQQKNVFGHHDRSYIYNVIDICFNRIKRTTLTGNCYPPNHFTTKRVIVIEMK